MSPPVHTLVPGDAAPRGTPCCPRCGGARVVRWGHLGSRRRYRCHTCRRTFSTNTGTPLAYLKKPERWIAFRSCTEACLTVRATAGRIGVHKDTVFRWRHRLLGAVRSATSLRLTGHVSVGELWLLHSEKGSRSLGRPPRRHGSTARWIGAPRTWVFLAMDDHRSLLTIVTNFRRATVPDLERELAPALDRTSVLLSPEGRFGSAGVFAHGAGITYRQVARACVPRRESATGGPIAHGDEAIDLLHGRLGRIPDWGCRFKRWLRRFRGVASRYLANYLTWYISLGRVSGSGRRLEM